MSKDKVEEKDKTTEQTESNPFSDKQLDEAAENVKGEPKEELLKRFQWGAEEIDFGDNPEPKPTTV